MSISTDDDGLAGRKKLAETVIAELNRRRWSLGDAEKQTGINKSTWHRLTNGTSVEIEAIIRAAYALAEKGKGAEAALQWLEWSGKATLVDLLRAVERAARQQPESAQQVVELEPGRKVRILAWGNRPGREFEATPANLAAVSTLLSAIEEAAHQGDQVEQRQVVSERDADTDGTSGDE